MPQGSGIGALIVNNFESSEILKMSCLGSKYQSYRELAIWRW